MLLGKGCGGYLAPPTPPFAPGVSSGGRVGGARLCSPQHSFIMPASALFLSRLESRDVVCTDEEHIGVAFADALGGETSQAALDTRAQMVDEKPANEHKKLNLGPNLSLFLLRQRVIYEMAAGGFDFAATTARCLVRAL